MNSKVICLSGFLCLAIGQTACYAQETIKVGILHSLTGTMAISEAPLKDTLLMLIDEQNKRGGLLGKKLEAIVIDPKSNWPLYAEKTRQLLERDKVAVIFGCWTSASRKAVIPVLEEHDGLLFYPVQYEGQESSKHIFYTGAAPNQQALPAVDYLIGSKSIQRWFLVGTDYVYPRTTNKILIAYLKSKGVAIEDISLNYSPFGNSNWSRLVSNIKQISSQGKKTAVISTINGDANLTFYQELIKQRISARDTPVIAFSIGEQELSAMDSRSLAGHLATWNYFMSIKTRENNRFVNKWREFTGRSNSVTNDPMEAHYIGFNMWTKAVVNAGTTNVDDVRREIIGVSVTNLSGNTSLMLANHHITKPVMIGEIRSDGQFNVVWKSAKLIAADAWSDYLPASTNIVADWRPEVECERYTLELDKCLD